MEKMIDRGSLWSFYGSYNLPVYISLDWGERQREFVWGGEIEHTGSGEFTSTCPNPDGGINPPQRWGCCPVRDGGMNPPLQEARETGRQENPPWGADS
jgi:hypothetical protein